MDINSYGMIFITTNMKKGSKKYNNTALQFSLLEAGHVAQNAYIYSSVNNIGIFEYTGFNYKLLQTMFENKNTITLTTLIFGENTRNTQKSKKKELDTIKKKINSDIVSTIHFEVFPTDNYMFKYHMITIYNSKNVCVAGASDFSKEKAELKAISEAYERYYFDLASKKKRYKNYLLRTTKIRYENE